MSAMSKPFGWVTTRCAVESVSSAVICRVMPRSSLALSAMTLMFDTPVPNWRRVTSLMFCAHTIGKPVIAPLATAAPDTAAPRLSMVRRERVRVVFLCFGTIFLLLRPGGACGFHSTSSACIASRQDACVTGAPAWGPDSRSLIRRTRNGSKSANSRFRCRCRWARTGSAGNLPINSESIPQQMYRIGAPGRDDIRPDLDRCGVEVLLAHRHGEFRQTADLQLDLND